MVCASYKLTADVSDTIVAEIKFKAGTASTTNLVNYSIQFVVYRPMA